MKKIFPVVLLAVCCSCVTDEDDKGAINPSDVAYIGTGLAVVSSAGVDDVFEDDDSDNSSFNSSFNSSNPNSANSTDTRRTQDLECSAQLSLSGALTESLSSTGCGAGFGGGSTEVLTWSFGNSEWVLQFLESPVRSASDTSDFDTEVIFFEFQLGDDADAGWLTTCTVSIDSSEPYTDDLFRDERAIWRGRVNCPDPAPAVERADPGSDWVTIDGESLQIDSMTFVTPYPHTQ